MQLPQQLSVRKSSIEFIAGSQLSGADLNSVAQKYCVHSTSNDGRKQQKYSEIEELNIRKNLADVEGLNHGRWATENGAWLTVIPQPLSSTELPRE